MAGPRADIDVKSDIVAELEDLPYLDTDQSLLDALVVEQVSVEAGRADVLLVFDDDVPLDAREAISDQIRGSVSDVEGLIMLVIEHVNRTRLAADQPNLLRPNPLLPDLSAKAAPAATNGATPPPAADGASDGLSLASLLSSAVAGVPEEEFEAPGLDLGALATDDAGVSIYFGGGCAAGTSLGVAEPPEPPAPAATPVAAPKAGLGLEVVKKTAGAVGAATMAGGQVSLSLERYTELVKAEAELALLKRLLE